MQYIVRLKEPLPKFNIYELNPREIKALAFDYFDESKEDDDRAYEARQIWSATHGDEARNERYLKSLVGSLKHFDVRIIPKYFKHTQVVAKATKVDVCLWCNGRGKVKEGSSTKDYTEIDCPECEGKGTK